MASPSRSRTARQLAETSKALRKIAGKRAVAPATRFLKELCEGARADDLRAASADDLAAAVLHLWKFATKRKASRPQVRVYVPDRATHGWEADGAVVEVVAADMPFLIDSITALLSARRHSIRLMLQKTEASGQRGRDSILHLQIGRIAGKDAAAELEQAVRDAIADVTAAVRDWRTMLGELDRAIRDLEANPPRRVSAADVRECVAFLRWIEAGNFALLGSRTYRYRLGEGKAFTATAVQGHGILRSPDVHVLAGTTGLAAVSAEVRDFLDRPAPMLITKTKARSRVHRVAPMDYVGVKRYAKDGRVIGETRFVGLFTAAAYNLPVSTIPLLRAKVDRVIRRSGFDPGSHTGKALLFVLDTFPRDELFQVSERYLLDTAMGILENSHRPRVRLFVRVDPFERFASALVFVPRDAHSSDLTATFGDILCAAFDAEVSTHYTQMGDSPLARVHFILRTNPGEVPRPDLAALERRLADAARRWEDELVEALLNAHGDAAARLAATYREAFPAGYRETYAVAEALEDIARLEALEDGRPLATRLYRAGGATPDTARFKVFRAGDPVMLSDVLPLLEDAGLRVVDERPYRIRPDGAATDLWIQDLGLVDATGADFDLAGAGGRFLEMFAAAWSGESESDGFNRLVLHAGMTARQVVIMRAIAKFLRQAAIAFSQEYMEDTLARNPRITADIVALFEARFDPGATGDRGRREKAIATRIAAGLESVANLDEDRILRRFLNVVRSMERTNFYQADATGGHKPYASFKIRSGNVDELPLPKPYAEIFVYSPRMEGVHLRGGRVARGGIRWSDRREDFRTEILGLMKAQMVKNSVIVPVGAKGGFVLKRPPPPGDREAFLAEGVECYRMLMRGLLDITDNQGAKNVEPPADVVRHDSDDPYLVVAADKGTATFSDIANGMSRDYGFWLDDAFASGGSVGYDHKKMGITARGAWESVKRHFREIGLDTQSEAFSVVGIGDMAGDVFGNGMLLSPQIRLVGAFNHIHIFVDPDPADPAQSLRERQRLFDTPRSAWTDYDPTLISRGGGVFLRSAKSVPVSPQMKSRFGIDKDALAPNELIRALLGAEVDLLWVGGIGTYVKAADERNAEVGDRANDALRLNGRQLRCKVVGEGGNLGFTQRGRIEFARNGGRINTDAVDNSAGVDCSDHEVNIKILLGQAMAAGELTMAPRDKLLAAMTDEVATQVLRDNYLQTQAITAMQLQAAEKLDPQARFARELERAGKLDRALESLPDDETLAEREAAREGMFRPELSVLLAYAKNTLYQSLLESDVPDDPYFGRELELYFPSALRKRFAGQISRHRLRREIIATAIANSVVNRNGASFVSEVAQDGGFQAPDIARAYAVVRDVFRLRPLWEGIEALDNKVPADVQTRMLVEIEMLVRTMTQWFLHSESQPMDIADTVQRYADGTAALELALPNLLRSLDSESFGEREARFVADGVPADLARRIAALAPLRSAGHIVSAANTIRKPVTDVGDVFFGVGALLGLDWLRAAAVGVSADSHWQSLAVGAIIDDLYSQQRALAGRVLAAAARARGDRAVRAWEAANAVTVARTRDLIAEFRAGGTVDIARLALANRQVRAMLSGR